MPCIDTILATSNLQVVAAYEISICATQQITVVTVNIAIESFL